ncbi:MAG: hypothetical protein PSN34_15740, partial [Urechidicola sp.]|nr:hypothetical protein [Urechidicola sp.]
KILALKTALFLYINVTHKLKNSRTKAKSAIAHIAFFPPLTNNANYSLLFKLNTKVSFAYFN